MRGKTIRQFLIDGIADGRWVTELSNWTGKAYKIPRTLVSQCSDRKDLNNTGVYFLFGINDETDQPQVYIGEAENIFTRLKQHLAEKDFWTECVAFISKDNNLNKAHIKYLEHHLYQSAKANRQYEVLNSTVPTESSISEMDQAEMEEFLDNMRLILGVLGHTVLEPAVRKSPHANEPVYLLQKAKGRPTPNGFAILKGSVIAPSPLLSMSQGTVSKRDQLIRNGIVDSNWQFTQDRVASSPSLAASLVYGCSMNGRTAWKTAKGQTLKDAESES